MSERDKRKRARAVLSKAGYRAGGHIRSKADQMEDEHADKALVAKGVHEHEANLHKGRKRTKLKLKRGGIAMGEPPKERADRHSRGGKTKGKGHTTVNIGIHSGQPQAQPIPIPMPPHPPMAGPPMGAGPPGLPPGGPPGMPPPGMKPPGMLKRGGKAKRSKGGKAYPIDDGAGGGEGRLEKAKAYGAARRTR